MSRASVTIIGIVNEYFHHIENPLGSEYPASMPANVHICPNKCSWADAVMSVGTRGIRYGRTRYVPWSSMRQDAPQLARLIETKQTTPHALPHDHAFDASCAI